jgi:hypothetical protein
MVVPKYLNCSTVSNYSRLPQCALNRLQQLSSYSLVDYVKVRKLHSFIKKSEKIFEVFSAVYLNDGASLGNSIPIFRGKKVSSPSVL